MRAVVVVYTARTSRQRFTLEDSRIRARIAMVATNRNRQRPTSSASTNRRRISTLHHTPTTAPCVFWALQARRVVAACFEVARRFPRRKICGGKSVVVRRTEKALRTTKAFVERGRAKLPRGRVRRAVRARVVRHVVRRKFRWRALLALVLPILGVRTSKARNAYKKCVSRA